MRLKSWSHCLLRQPLGPISMIWAVSLVGAPLVWSQGAIAQVSPDTTLTDASTVSFDGTTYEITGGITNGSNLFHSFETFSLSSEEIAQFNNDLAIENIIGRVTGGAVSRINGLIEANGDANLFLINPNGVVFGENAELNIGGSFLATTAESLLFDGNGEFSATDPQAPPLLAINTPIGLQFGANPGKIRVNGPGSGLFIDPDFFDVNRSDRIPGLEVSGGETLALVGGDLIFNGGNVTAAQGRIELGSVSASQSVVLESSGDEWVLNYDQVNAFNSIRLSEAASVDVSGEGAGSVQSYGQTLRLEDGSVIMANTLGADDGKTVNIQMSDAIELVGGAVDRNGVTLIPSGIITEASFRSAGRGATAVMSAPQLNISSGAQVVATTFGSGEAGDIRVKAEDISLSGLSPDDPDEAFASGLFSTADVGDTGQGGNIEINTNTLFVFDDAQIAATTFGEGTAGDIAIVADDITLDSNGDIAAAVDTVSQAIGDLSSTGNGGSITINVVNLRLANGGDIATTTFSAGNGGTIDITAQAVELVGSSVIAADVSEGATGNGGLLRLEAESLAVGGGAQLLTTTAGLGQAGDLTVDVQKIELTGFDDVASSGFVASAVIGRGAGGTIQVTADQLTVMDGATITVGNFGTLNTTPPGLGESGNIEINADVIRLNNGGSITASSVNGLGNIDITNSDFLLLSQEGSITTNASGTAAGGNININTGVLSGLGNSDITANAVNERGGRIIINADNIFGFQVSDLVDPSQSATSDITASSRLGSDFSGIVRLNTPDTDSAQLVTRLPDNLLDQSNLVGTACNFDRESALMLLGQGGLPTSPFGLSSGLNRWVDLRLSESLPPSRSVSNQPNSSAFSRPLSPSPPAQQARSLAEITGWRRNDNDSLELISIHSPQHYRDTPSCQSISTLGGTSG